MGQYMILIYEDATAYAEAGEAAWKTAMEEHTTFSENNVSVLRGGEALQPATTATTVRANGSGAFTVTDGPFFETKEVLGGYYLVEAKDLDDALAIAQQVPARFGGVEVRPVMVFD